MSVHEYWQTVRKIASDLPEAVYLTSLDSRTRGTQAGAVCLCSREIAARRIAEGTHRVATEAEVEQYKAHLEAERRRIVEEDYRRKQQFALPSELAELVRAAVEPRARGRA
jgi:hypothetical protein